MAREAWEEIRSGNIPAPVELTRAAAGSTVLESRVEGDALPRFTIDADGRLEWGTGAAAPDTAFGRFGVSELGALSGQLVSLANVVARRTGAARTDIGDIGPSAQSGIQFSGGEKIYRAAAGVLKHDVDLQSRTELIEGTAGAGFLSLLEQSADPGAPNNARARLFARDVAGKTQVCARFATGAVQVIAAEP